MQDFNEMVAKAKNFVDAGAVDTKAVAAELSAMTKVYEEKIKALNGLSYGLDAP